MSIEVKIVADNATALLAKLAEVAKSMSSGGAEPITVSTMMDAINMQLPAGMVCKVVDQQLEEKKEVKPAKKSKPKSEPVEEKKVEAPPKKNEMFDEALKILSSNYNNEDGKAAVKNLLGAYGVSRFSEIDTSHGPDLLKQALKIQDGLQGVKTKQNA